MTTQTWWKDLPNERLIETAWERQMNLAGVESFERARFKANGDVRAASESVTGQKIMRKLIKTSSQAIEEMQSNIMDVARVERQLKGTVLLMPSDIAALLTVRSLLDSTYNVAEQEVGTSYQILCKDIAKSVELELNFRHWIRESKEAAKAYAKEHNLDKTPTSFAERMVKEHGVTRRSLVRWKQTFEDLNTYKWDEKELHFCGEALLLPTIKTLPEMFEIKNIFLRGRTVKHVLMLPEFRQEFDESEMKTSLRQVVRKPMLTKPRKWTKEE